MGPEDLVFRLRAIREPRIRVCALIEALGEGDPGAWVQALAALIGRAQGQGDADANLAVQSLTHATGDPTLAVQSLTHATGDPALPGPLRAHAAELRATARRRGGA